jgi:SPP1 gp7 family putative phage head morphogenesis protein
MNLTEEICRCGEHTEALMKAAFRLDISKALDPTDPDDFLIISARLSAALAKAARPAQGAALREALNALDVDWPNITPEARRNVIAAARGSIVSVPPQIIPPITNTLEVRGTAITRGTRKAVRREVGTTLAANVGVDMALRDQGIVDHLISSQAFFVTDEYGRRAEFFSASAKNIVASGIDQGLGQDEISRMLQAQMGNALGPKRSRNYWNVIASVFTNRARTYAQLSGYSEAGIRRYRWESILDEVTTETCYFLHGKEWTVGAAIQQFRDVAEASDPQAVKDIQPWFRQGRDDDGNGILFTQDRAGNRTTMAQIIAPASGSRDGVGEYKATQAFNDVPAHSPPLHGL